MCGIFCRKSGTDSIQSGLYYCCGSGPVVSLNLVWTVADILNALMAIPNLVAVLLLSNVIVKETKKYINDLDKKDDTPVEVIDR